MCIVESSSRIAKRVEGKLNTIYSVLETLIDGSIDLVNKDLIESELANSIKYINARFEQKKLNHATYKALCIRIACVASFVKHNV